MIVASQLPIINAEITKILQGIVDFNVELVLDDETGDSLEIYINYGDSRRPIELGSGMEKTIASIALRVALINVSSLPKPDFFVLDEIGNLDAAQVEACNRLLVSLKHYFRTIILITHVDGAKDIADHVIEITRDEKDSRVTYNESWRGDRT
jgi:DNA repair exonuclease SbcCD ATPase subunit